MRHNAALPEGRTRTYDNGRCITLLLRKGVSPSLTLYRVIFRLPDHFCPLLPSPSPPLPPPVHTSRALEFAITILWTFHPLRESLPLILYFLLGYIYYHRVAFVIRYIFLYLSTVSIATNYICDFEIKDVYPRTYAYTRPCIRFFVSCLRNNLASLVPLTFGLRET